MNILTNPILSPSAVYILKGSSQLNTTVKKRNQEFQKGKKKKIKREQIKWTKIKHLKIQRVIQLVNEESLKKKKNFKRKSDCEAKLR